MNQYIKNDAARKWTMTSEKLMEEGYTPNHPLYFESKVPIQSAASLLLKILVHKRIVVKNWSKIIARL